MSAALGDIDAHDWADYAQIDSDEAARIKADTGDDMTGWKRSLIATEVRKIIRDHSADQRPITPADFEKLPLWFSKAKKRQKIVRKGRPPVLKTTVKDGAQIWIIEEIRTGRKKLVLLSIYRP